MDAATEERVNQPVPWTEFPKMLHHPDGRTVIVEDAEGERDALNSDFVPTPDAALKIRAERDAADATRVKRKIGAEAKAAGLALE